MVVPGGVVSCCLWCGWIGACSIFHGVVGVSLNTTSYRRALGVIVYIFTGSLLKVAALWVIACPCSLTLVTPMAVVVSIGNSARKGILIRYGESLERLASIDVLAIDKTGTITTGRPEVLAVKGFGTEENIVLGVAATAEMRSEHPLARAIIEKAGEVGVSTDDPESGDGAGSRRPSGDEGWDNSSR